MNHALKTLLIVDGLRYLPKALHFGSSMELIDPPGASTFAVCINYVHKNMRKMPKQFGADYVAYLFDHSLPIYREEFDRENTKESVEIRKQVETIHELLRLFGWQLLLVSDGRGVDVIATLATAAATQGMRVIIATNNIYLYQFASENIKFLFDSFHHPRLDGDGVTGLLARQLVDYLTLVGIFSDKAAKVAGVGPKTAVKLLQRFDTLDNILRNVANIKGIASAALAAAGDSLLVERDSLLINNSADIVGIIPGYPSLESLKLFLPNYNRLRDFYTAHGFSYLADIAALGNVGRVSAGTLTRMLSKDKIPTTKDLIDPFSVPEKFRGIPVVYAITNRRTGQRYFGSAASAERRSTEHMKLLVGNAHSNWKLNEDYQQYGRDNFEFRILASFSSIAEARQREQLYLSMFWGRSNCYNISPFAVEADAENLKLQLLTASNMKIFHKNKKSMARASARQSGYGRYLSVHAAARDLGLSKTGILETIDSGDGVFNGWDFKVTPLKWTRQEIDIG